MVKIKSLLFVLLSASVIVVGVGCKDSDQLDSTKPVPSATYQDPPIGGAAVPTPRVASIDWDAADGQPKIATTFSASLAETHVPVLVPNDSELLSVARVIAEENWYSISMVSKGHRVIVYGSGMVFDVPGLAPSAEDAERPRWSPDELGSRVAFQKYGAAYTITIVCDAWDSDSRCLSGDYGLALAANLVLVGGSP